MSLYFQRGVLRLIQLQPQRYIGLMALAVALLLTSMVAYDLRRDYQQQFAVTASRAHGLTQLLEEHAIQSMRRVELAMALAAQKIHTDAANRSKPGLATGAALQAFLPQDDLIASFAVLDAKGQTIASTLTKNPGDLPSASDRDFYLAHQDPTFSGLFVGAAVRSRISGRWIVPVSMRLRGKFDGYLLAAVDPAYFERLYQSIDTGSEGFVSLYTTQGWVAARWPFHADVAERNSLDSALFTDHINAPAETGDARMAMPDGTVCVFSYRKLRAYPLVVVLGLSVAENLVPWRQRVLYECTALVLVLVALAGATVLVTAQLRRRQRAESALKLSEISVLKSSLPTLWIGPDARILRVNHAACALHGYSEDQMLRMTVMDLSPVMTPEKWPAHWERLRAAKNLHFEAVHRSSTGAEVPVEVELNFLEFEGQEFNFAFMRDLTVRRKADAELQRSAAMLRGAIDAVDEAFVLFDASDTLVYCNERYRQLYPDMADVVVPGARFEDMVREGARRGVYRESLGREEAWITERLDAHRQGQESRIQKRDDGRVLRVIDRRTPEGNIVGIRVDITDMVRATEEAQDASRYKSQFLANMSHEIRTPMNAILGLLTLLQKTELNSVQRDYANKTQGAAQSLLGLLNDILDFSKVEAGKLELDPQPLRLDQMLSDIAVILSPAIGTKSIDVLFDIDASVPAEVMADAMRLQQVLVNLLGNAIKFTSEGQVVLRLGMVAPPGPEGLGEPWLHFAVMDSGIGIAEDKQAHVFSGFSQAEASTTRRFGGTGLGLAISKRLVELMGGTLELKSTPGRGSTFRFSLPLQRLDAATSNGPLETAALPQSVLVVDDNPVSRDIVCAMVRAWGWPVDSVASGQDALAWAQARAQQGAAPVQLVVLDWQMPGMDGWQTAHALHQFYQDHANPPRVIMLSSNARDSLGVRTAQEQALVVDLLFKPVRPKALHDAAMGRTAQTPSRLALRSSSRPLAGMRVLVVEDNLINQQVAEELLNAEGALVSLAANGQLGVDAVKASQPPFDVVLMDIQMPVLDGYAATRKIRDELGLRALPIVAMTANAMASDRMACLAAGMNEHIGKPFDMRHLVSVLQRVTGRDASQAEDLAASQATPDAPSAVDAVTVGVGEEVTASPARFSRPYLDVDAALQRIAGMQDLYVSISRDFLETLDRTPAEFTALAQSGDLPALAAAMHSLKGTSATLGAMRLSEEAAKLEKMLRKPAPGLEPLAHLDPLVAVLHHTRAAMAQAIEDMQEPQAATAQPAKPMDASALRQARVFLEQLAAVLAQSDLSALEQFNSRGEVLDGLDAQEVEGIHAALQSLDLARALALCQACIARLAEQGV